MNPSTEESKVTEMSRQEALPTPVPGVYAYTDYRAFLGDFYLAKKTKTPTYSYRSFALKARLKSPNYLKLVIDGQRRLTDKNLAAFLKGLGLEGDEALYFRFLVEISHTSDPKRIRELRAGLDRLRSKHTRIPDLITGERSRILEKWSYWIIRELARTHDFKLDATWISERLSKRIDVTEAQEAIELLLDLRFLVEVAPGKWTLGEALVSSGDEREDLLVRELHRQLIGLSLDSLARDAVSEREFGAVTIAIPQTKVARAKELMKRFRREFHQLMSEEDALGDEVYQLNMAFFPLTKRIQRKKK